MKYLFAGFTTVDIINGKQYPGGAAASLALKSSTLGIESHLLSVLSISEHGQWYRSILEKNSVQFPYSILTAPDIPSCIIPDTINHEGSTRQWNDNGALPSFSTIHIPKEYLISFDLLFIVTAPRSLTDILASIITDEPFIYIPGPQIVHNPNILNPTLLLKAQILFATQEEWEIIQKNLPNDHTIEIIVVTNGKHGGTIYKKKEQPLAYHADQVSEVVDTTGAGDTFALYFCHSYIQHHNIQLALKEAINAASHIIQQYGSVNANVIH